MCQTTAMTGERLMTTAAPRLAEEKRRRDERKKRACSLSTKPVMPPPRQAAAAGAAPPPLSVPLPATAHLPATSNANAAASAAAQQDALSVILVTGGYDNTIRFWEAWSGVCSRTLNHQEHVSGRVRAGGREARRNGWDERVRWSSKRGGGATGRPSASGIAANQSGAGLVPCGGRYDPCVLSAAEHPWLSAQPPAPGSSPA